MLALNDIDVIDLDIRDLKISKVVVLNMERDITIEHKESPMGQQLSINVKRPCKIFIFVFK